MAAKTVAAWLLVLWCGVSFGQSELNEAQKRTLQEQAIHILGGNANVISRWQASIRPRVVGEPSERSLQVIAQTFDDIADITGLGVEVIEPRRQTTQQYLQELVSSEPYLIADCGNEECANFIVVIASSTQMQKIAAAVPLRPVYQQSLQQDSAPLCFFSPFQTGMMQIVQSLVYIQADLPAAMIDTCIREEIYQSFGMFSDVTGSEYFSFDNREEPKAITYYDQQLLRAIYDPSLRAGAPAFRVVGIFMRAFSSLK